MTPAVPVCVEMWLINCHTLTLEEHLDYKNTNYALLSHTWEQGEEVQFDEFINKTVTDKKGWKKIEMTCQLAIKDGFDFAWVDTCCIDKKSSAELSEAINSMFPWYKGAKVCYVYLADYHPSSGDLDISKSRWFSRGWTLQELIAPARVQFFDREWTSFGSKESLSEQLSLITGIEEEVLLASDRDYLLSALGQVPVARKMSWASKRDTTRVEDMAYCLLGIFGINLPLLYGEGEAAFIRLQEEIMKKTNDLSILAWSSHIYEKCTIFGVLARHPQYFRNSRNLAFIRDSKQLPDFTSTNKGLKLETNIMYNDWQSIYALDINCLDLANAGEPLSIHLQHIGDGVFSRMNHNILNLPAPRVNDSADGKGWIAETRTIFLAKSSESGAKDLFYTFSGYGSWLAVPKIPYHPMLWKLSVAHPKNLWEDAEDMFNGIRGRDFVGCHEYLPIKPNDAKWKIRPFLLVFGFGYGFLPWIRVQNLQPNDIIHREITHERWKQVAQLANVEINGPMCIGNDASDMQLTAFTESRSMAIILRASLMVDSKNLNFDQRVIFKVEKWKA